METGVLIRSLLAISLGASLRHPALGIGNGIQCAVPDDSAWYMAGQYAGGYLIGLALAYFGQHAGLSPEWRLFIITGFLGGLTTFSTFSAEVTTLIQQERLLWAGVAVSVHVGGSLLMTLLGLATYEIGRHL